MGGCSDATDLLFTFFADTWSDAVDRGCCFTLDRMIIEAGRDPRIDGVAVANPYRSAPVRALRRLQGCARHPLPPSTGPSALISPLRLRRADPVSPRQLELTYRAYDRRLRRAGPSLAAAGPAVVTANPFVAAYSPLEWASSVTYFGYDDWAASSFVHPWWGAIEDAYRRIARNGRRVAAVSSTILDRIEPSGPSAVIPNGVEPTEWESPWTVPDWCAGSDAPMVLYLGSVSDRLDTAMLRRTAEHLPHTQVVVVGAVLDRAVLGDLGGVKNLRIESPVGRAEATGLVRRADVCVMPHRSTRLTDAMSPLKLYEYLAAGRPTVVTDLVPVRDVDPRVVVAPVGDAGAFAAAVEQALALGPAGEEERRRFVERNSWSARFDQLLDLIGVGAGRGAPE